MIDYDGRRFRSLSNSAGGDVNAATEFSYHQKDRIVWATYVGGGVRFGTLIAQVADDGTLDMRYQHVSDAGQIKTGTCVSTPVRLEDGRLTLNEAWQWTSGGVGEGTSVIEEIGGGGED